jgi:predicted metal-dependent phosphoesterase TrpH
MLPGKIDLHLHTTCSDGIDTPEDIAREALARGYLAIAITDHDSVEGIDRGKKACEGTDLEIIPGIELSSIDSGDDVHILGYYIDFKDEEFIREIEVFRNKRLERAEAMVKILNELGMKMDMGEVLGIANGAPVGRPHIAEALLYRNHVDTFNEAFEKYIGTHAPAYVPKAFLSPGAAVKLILKFGGVPVIAHPGVLGRDDLIDFLVVKGLKGVEAIHPLHSPKEQEKYRKYADSRGIIATGGSDWHGRTRRQSYYNFTDSSIVSPYTLKKLKYFAGAGN